MKDMTPIDVELMTSKVFISNLLKNKIESGTFGELYLRLEKWMIDNDSYASERNLESTLFWLGFCNAMTYDWEYMVGTIYKFDLKKLGLFNERINTK